MAPNIKEISSTFEFDNLVNGLPPSQLLVVDFHAVWCGPCHAIAPVLEALSNKTSILTTDGQFMHVKFVKIDVDKQAQLAQRFSVRAMPTFKLLKGGKEIGELRGASPQQLNSLVAQHAGPSPAPGAASTASGSAATPAAGPSDSIVSLLPHITSKGLTCLNESSAHPLSSIIGPNAGPKGRSFLESDVDAELLISIPFNETVKLKAIQIFSGVSPAQAPKSIKLFINHISVDFSDTESLTPAQEIELTPEDVKGNKVDLRFVRFQNVRSLHVLVKDNQEDEETTRIDSLDVFGTVGAVADKGPLTKMEHEH